MQPRLRSLYQYTMCKRIANPLPDQSVSVRRCPCALLERHRPAGGTAAPAGGRSGPAFAAPVPSPPTRWSALEKSSERIRGKGAFLRLCAPPCAVPTGGRSLSMAMLTCPFQTCSGVRFGAAWTVERLAPWVRVGARCARPPGCARKAATWLILPVVICLSQRLSHACLSINCFIL